MRVNYFKNNYIDVGLHASYTLLKPVFWDNYGDGNLNFATGLDISMVYGWEKIKLGTGFQADYIGRFDRNNSDDVSDTQFSILWVPLKVVLLF